MRKFLVAIPIARLAIGGSTACATKKFVRTSVGEVNDKVDSIGPITRRDTGADAPQRGANHRSRHEGRPQRSRRRAGGARPPRQRSSAAASGRTARPTPPARKADAVDKASKRLVYEVVLSEDEGNFKFAKTELPDEAKAKLDQMITAIKADPKGAYFEIEGHTDNVGDAKTNERIGLERAEAVKRYLYEQHQIPLHKMNVISYGEDKPVAPNKTRDGRAQNRRVVIKVLA